MKLFILTLLPFLALNTATSPAPTVRVPEKTVVKAFWADVNGNNTVKAQWESEKTVVKYAWD